MFLHTVAMLQGEPSLLHTPICVHQLVVHKHCHFKVNSQLKKSSSLSIGQDNKLLSSASLMYGLHKINVYPYAHHLHRVYTDFENILPTISPHWSRRTPSFMHNSRNFVSSTQLLYLEKDDVSASLVLFTKVPVGLAMQVA